MSKNISYITAEFFENEKEKIEHWVKSAIKDSDLCKTLENGKIGGYTTNDLHLTLFYGFDEDQISIEHIQKWIKATNLKKIETGRVGAFIPPNQEYKILHLTIIDEGEKLKKLHEELKSFPHFAKYQRSRFIPHITIAFVKKDFDENIISYNGAKTLYVKQTVYHQKMFEFVAPRSP